MITRRNLLIGLGLGALVPGFPSLAQQGRVWRVGVLETQPMATNAANFEALRRGLRELGYFEGKNLLIEYRSVDGRLERFAELAKDLVRLKVDLIVTRGTPATQAARNATASIPIVSAAFSDPVSMGLVKSLARPAGNVTGFEPFALELTSKRVELLKETFPQVARIGVMANMSLAVTPPMWREVESTARTVGIEALFLDVRKVEDLAPAFESAAKQRIGAVMVGLGTLTQTNRGAIVTLAARYRLPVIYLAREFVDAGGLMSYGVSYPQLYYRVASYVDKIFKGERVGDLPVEQPTKLELVINLKTAKALGITIPPPVLLRADEVID
jgi:putative ABC transport system substrate-binding protein